MSVLITCTSPHRSTAEVAHQIADRLVKSGFEARVRSIEQVESIQSRQPIVIGSDVRDKDWLPQVERFLRRFSSELVKSPVWLFSTGAESEPSSFGPKLAMLVADPPSESAGLSGARDTIRIRGHRYFGGAFERGGWSLLGDLFSRICGGSPPDHRNWRDVNAWAADIARDLQHIDHVQERRRLHLSVRGRP